MSIIDNTAYQPDIDRIPPQRSPFEILHIVPIVIEKCLTVLREAPACPSCDILLTQSSTHHDAIVSPHSTVLSF